MQTCPHHRTGLTRFDFRGQALGRCLRCEGVWLPGAVVARVAGDQPQWPRTTDKPATALRCPEDGQPLYAVKARGVELDWCARCHGVWLDQGELAVIAAQQAVHVHPGSDAGSLDDLAEEGLDAGVDIAEHLVDRVGRRLSRAGQASPEVAVVEPPPLPSVSPASLDAEGLPFAVEVDPSSAVSDGVDAASGLLEAGGEVAGQLLDGALSLIGDIFSGL